MNIDFNNIINLTLTKENRFFGEGISRYRSVKNYTIEGVVHDGSAINNGSLTSFPDITGHYNTDNFDIVSVNGDSLGQGRITNVNIPQGDHIKRGIYTVNFLVYEDGDLSNISSDPNYAGLSSINYVKFLEDFSESFSFSAAQNNNYNYEHTINITYLEEDGQNAITLAKSLANQIFSASLPFGFLNDGPISSDYNTAGKKYFSESFNLITKSCSFTKRFEVLNEVSSNYSLEYKHSLVLDQDGNVNVSENGNIRIKTTPFTSYISSALSTVKGGAFSRCQTVFNRILNSSSATIGLYEPLLSTPIQAGELINRLNGDIQYTLSFTNNKYFYSKSTFFGTHEFTVNLNKNQDEIITVDEAGTFTVNSSESSQSMSSIINLGQALISDAVSRCSSLYNTMPNVTSLKEIGRSMDFKKEKFKILNYNVNYSDDPSLLTSDTNFTKVSYEIAIDKSKHIYQKYRIPNTEPFGTKGEYIYAGDQSILGTNSVRIRAVAKRPSSESTITQALNNLITTSNFNKIVNIYAAQKRLSGFTFNSNSLPENFITSCTFTVDSERNIEANVTSSFLGNPVEKYTPQL